MPRASLIRSSNLAYHVTVRSNNKDWFYVEQVRCWNYFAGNLSYACAQYGTLLHAFVLMSNHFHLILSTPRENLDAMMRYFLTEVGRDLRRDSGRINHVFGTRYKWTLLPSSESLAYAFKYVARNPVRAGITERVENYRFSTFHPSTIELASLPVVETLGPYSRLIPRDYGQRIAWLNEQADAERESLVAKALRRSTFGFPTHRNDRAALLRLAVEYGLPLADPGAASMQQK